jgi:flavin-binding protein dodecin
MLARETGQTKEARVSQGQVSDEYDGQGNGATLEEAAGAAWQNAKDRGKDIGWYEVKKIEVLAENPITEYKVTIKKV